jgi:spore germination cell wall hydrolase CwlJ-like protein
VYLVLESKVAGPFKLVLAAPLLAAALAGCATSPFGGLSSRDCMARAMYFESNRSSEDGMLAVGTVVMNRVADKKEYPSTVCGVVGQKNQFAPGVLQKPMKEKTSAARAYAMADKVLRGARHPTLGRDVKHFHTAGYSFKYNNMYYVLEAGGNNFYEKRKAGTFSNNPFADLVNW